MVSFLWKKDCRAAGSGLVIANLKLWLVRIRHQSKAVRESPLTLMPPWPSPNPLAQKPSTDGELKLDVSTKELIRA